MPADHPISSVRGALREIPFMGVIWVVHEAHKLGFYNGNPEWCNLGQGQPEIGPMEGAPPRISHIDCMPEDHAYGPVGGTDALKDAIAAHYNRLFRSKHRSQYTRNNVSVAGGGRLMLSRIFAAIDQVKLGYQVPDYTAYEDLLNYHRHRFMPVCLTAREEHGFAIPADAFRAAVKQHQLGAFVFSNPCNPTGAAIEGKELESYVATAREQHCTVVFDEFYSHFAYTADGKPAPGPVSAAPYVEDVERDPVLLVDGLTKCYRYPGWRLGWAVGPSAMIETLDRAASAIDGGPSRLVQRAALQVLEPKRADQETNALRTVFARKRNLMVGALKEMGIRMALEPRSTFYAWGSIAGLKAPLNDADVFFREGLKRKVMTVPGRFFDVNPGNLRRGPSPLAQWVRFSFGPTEANVREGLNRLHEMVKA